jgi:DNA-binding transcriptional LysR family regulator
LIPNGPIQGNLVVSAPAGFGRRHVAPHGPAFIKAHPQVRLSFNLSDRVVDRVREGYGLGIRIGGELDPSYVAIKLASNRRVVCAALPHISDGAASRRRSTTLHGTTALLSTSKAASSAAGCSSVVVGSAGL